MEWLEDNKNWIIALFMSVLFGYFAIRPHGLWATVVLWGITAIAFGTFVYEAYKAYFD